jgi:hypothetical protein
MPDPTVPPAALLAIDALLVELDTIIRNLRVIANDAEYSRDKLAARLATVRETARPEGETA